MRNVIAALTFLALVTSCVGEAVTVPTTTSTTTVETTSSTAFKLPPVGDTPEEVEAAFMRFLREWSAEQPEATSIDAMDGQGIVDLGRELCKQVTVVEAGLGGGRILEFYLFLADEFENQGFDAESFEAIFFRSMVMLCPEYGEAVIAVLLEALEDR